MSLPELSTRYPVTVTMATLAILLLGWISLGGLGTDLLPNVETPVITVDLRVAGKSPQEMEERYTRRLERDISTVSGVDRVYSMTRSGQTVVVAELDWDTDMDFALLDVQKRTGTYATDEDIDTIDVTQEDPQALPVARIAVSSTGEAGLDELLGTVDTLAKPRLEALSGVASAEIEGDAEKEIRIILDEYLLEAFGLTAATVVERIKQTNQDVSGGRLEQNDQSYQVKGLGRLRDITEVENLIVGERAGGAVGTAAGGTETADEETLRVPVYVADVGRVVLEYAERETIVRLGGVECLGLAVYKEADASTVTVVQTVLRDLEQLALDLPGVEFTVVENQARFVEQAVQEVEEAALYGAVLAVAVLLLFLRSIKVTLVIGMAIPISVLATFTLMYFQGLTLNIMTLGGLALGAGMLVDNAIVVIENIYRRYELGADPREASVIGASEVGVAILASTLTTVAVFLPIVYVEGLVGELFKEQAWTVAFSLVSSLLVAMTVVPMLTSRLLRRRTASPEPKESPQVLRPADRRARPQARGLRPDCRDRCRDLPARRLDRGRVHPARGPGAVQCRPRATGRLTPGDDRSRGSEGRIDHRGDRVCGSENGLRARRSRSVSHLQRRGSERTQSSQPLCRSCKRQTPQHRAARRSRRSRAHSDSRPRGQLRAPRNRPARGPGSRSGADTGRSHRQRSRLAAPADRRDRDPGGGASGHLQRQHQLPGRPARGRSQPQRRRHCPPSDSHRSP